MLFMPKPQYGTCIDELVEEHENILSMLAILEKVFIQIKEKKPVPPQHLKDILFFIRNYLGVLHHGKEEKILLPQINKVGLPVGGGPLCTLFKQKQMDRRIIYPKDFKVVPTQVSGLIDEGSPMHIILEDHQLGDYYVKRMEEVLEKIGQDDSEARAQFVNNARDYIDLLREHIDKENHCFFVSVDNCCNESDLKEMKSGFDRVEDEIGGRVLVDQCLHLLENLQKAYE